MKYEDELKKMSERMGNVQPFQKNNIGKNVSKIVKFGILSGATLMIGIGVAVFFLIRGVTSYIETEIEQTTHFSGDPTRFDPVTAYEEVHIHAGEETVLTNIDATMVKSDGTLDLTAQYKPAPRTTFTFYKILSEPPENAAPTGASEWYQRIKIDAYEPGQWRHVKSMGSGVNMEYTYQNRGLDKDESTPTSSKPSDQFIDPPTCHFSDLWATAIAQGTPKDLVANITYDEDGYEFIIRDTKTKLSFNSECQLIES